MFRGSPGGASILETNGRCPRSAKAGISALAGQRSSKIEHPEKAVLGRTIPSNSNTLLITSVADSVLPPTV
jgi:hypothetical protein